MDRFVLCRWHKDRSPSMRLYADGAYCFVCGKQATPEELGIGSEELPPEVEPEDLEETLRYIDSLPVGDIRGLKLPFDAYGYFILWPERDFYKKRLYDDSKGRYRCPRGHKQPPLWAGCGSDILCIVEGEINALSIAKACPHYDVMSPGGVGNFSAKAARLYLKNTVLYSTILLIADRDAPGAQAVIELMGALQGHKAKVIPKLMSVDANDILQGDNGCERLRKEIEGAVGG